MENSRMYLLPNMPHLSLLQMELQGITAPFCPINNRPSLNQQLRLLKALTATNRFAQTTPTQAKGQ